MKKFVISAGLGFGLITGGCLAYSFTYSESVRLVVSVLGAVLLTAALLLTTAWIVAASLARAYGNQRHTYRDEPRYYLNGAGQPPALPSGQNFYSPATQLDWVEGEKSEEIIG